MKRLWDEEAAAGSSRLRLETLSRLGGADTIVRGHLDDVMVKLPDDQRDAAAAAFRFLVTSTGRKIALSSEELSEFSEADATPLRPALEHLERERILRPVPAPDPGGETRHEIFHDVLAPAILDWRRRHVEERTESRLAQAREQAGRLEARNRRLAAVVIALTAIAVALALYVWNPKPLQQLELRTADARFSVRGGSTPDPRLSLITVDDRTLRRLDPGRSGTIPRGDYARILDRLRKDGPAAIALDVIFRGARTPRGDRALLRAIRGVHDRLVLAFSDFSVGVDASGYRTVVPDLFGRPAALQATGVGTGLATLPDDQDGHNRRADYVENIDNLSYGSTPVRNPESLAFAAANVVRRGALKADELPAATRRAWGGQSERTTWIDFRGPPGTIRRVSALDVLDGRVKPGAFANKVVVIGVIARGNPDVHRTPLDGGDHMSGPELQANALDTILRGSPLRDAPRIVDILLLILLACLPAVAALTRSWRIAVAAVAAGAVAFLVGAQLAFNAGRIVAVVAPLAALLLASSGVAGLAVARTMRRRRGAGGTRPTTATNA